MADMTPEELAAQQARLGVPDPTGAQVVLPMNPNAAPVSGPISLEGQPVLPPMQEKPLLGQTAAPPLVDPATVHAQPSVSQEQPYQPPGPQTVSTTDARTQIQMGQKLDPELQAQLHASQAAEFGAVARKNEIQAATDEKLAAVEQRRAEDEARLRQAQEKAAAERKRIADEHAQKVADAQKEADAVKGPEAEGIGTQIRNRIALALGAFGAGLTGGPNHAAQAIAADREEKMQAWKAQYARAKGKVDSAQNLYALFRNKGLDEESSEALAIKNLNDGYSTIIRGQLAGSKAPLEIANGEAELERIRQGNLAQDQRLQQAAQNQVTRVIDSKSVTKAGGADTKEKNELLSQVDKDKPIQDYRAKSEFLSRFNNLVKSGADALAVGSFIAGKEGMDQGSYGPSMQAMLKKYSWLGGGLEKAREALKGGADPEFVKQIGNAIALDSARAQTKAADRINYFKREFHQAGMPPSMVIGGETPTEAAAQAGAIPSTYQGKQ